MKKSLAISCLLAGTCLSGFANNTIHFGALVNKLNDEAASTRLVAYQHFSAELSKALGETVRFTPYYSTSTMWQALDHGDIAMAYVKVFPYVSNQANTSEVKPLLTVLSTNPVTGKLQRHYQASIVTLAKSNINTVQGLKHKRFGFTAQSTSGFFYPAMFLKKHGISYRHDLSATFYPNHLAALAALNHGQVDAIAVWKNLFLQEAKSYPHQHYRIIASMHHLPNPLFVINGRLLSAKAAQSLQAAMLHLNKKAYAGLSFSGVIKPDHKCLRDASRLYQKAKGLF